MSAHNNIESELDNAEAVSPENTSPEKNTSRVRKVLSGVGNAYKYTWYTCLDSAVTIEEKVINLGKQMAVKGAGIDIKARYSLGNRKTKLSAASEGIRHKAQEKIVDVEQIIDKGVNRSLHFMGVPSRKDMDQMTSLMKDMADNISELSTQLQDHKIPASRPKKSKVENQTAA